MTKGNVLKKDASTGTSESPLPLDYLRLSNAISTDDLDGFVNHLTGWLKSVSDLGLRRVDTNLQQVCTLSAETIGYLLTRPTLQLKRKHYFSLLAQHATISNVFAISSYKDTSSWLDGLKGRSTLTPAHLLLANARSAVPIDRDLLFRLDPAVASEWYGQYFFNVRSFVSKRVLDNLVEHIGYWNDALRLLPTVSNAYMRSTYIYRDLDRQWKFNFNRLVQSNFRNLSITNKPKWKKIAVVTGRWAPVNPTYKNRLPLFTDLAQQFDLTLVHVGPERKEVDTTIFKDVKNVALKNGRIEGDALMNNDFGMIFYPDIGMNPESRFLSNLRLAPIQITTNSHPVSTFGSKIDFFLTGADSEEDLVTAERNYSERLVLIPGIGTLPVVPQLKKQPTSKKLSATDGVLRIACPWGCLKINHALIQSLRKIHQRAKVPVRFRFLASMGGDSAHIPPIINDIRDILGAVGFDFFVDNAYDDYMQYLSECDLALDAFPFGGNTSIVDCMYLRIPIVTRKGWQFYNMAGPIIQQRFGLGDLVATSEESYVNIASALINNEDFRKKMDIPLKAVDFKTTLEGLTSRRAFVASLEYLRKKRPDPAVRTPLVFGDEGQLTQC